MRASRFILPLIAALTLAGCQSDGLGPFARNAPPLLQQNVSAPAVEAAPMAPVVTQPIPAAPPPVVAMEPEDTAYMLGSGDKLRVVVFGQEGLSASYAVDTAGNITMPLIGAVRAQGMTTAGLQRSVVARLRNGYVREPHVAVEVETYRPFFILGEVTLPGQYPYVPNMTVETAVAIAGGYTPRAFKYKIEISRPVDGLTERRVVSRNYPIRPGDTVHIAERWF